MNSAYGAWGDYGGPFNKKPFQGGGTVGTGIQTVGTVIQTFKPSPQMQAALTAAANGQASSGGASGKGPSLEEILAGIGAMFAPKTVVDTQVAEAQTAAADGSPRKPWLLIGVGVAGVTVLGVGAYFLLRSKRRR